MIKLHLRHRFPNLDLNLAFAVPAQGATVLFGPSGAGKSTAMAAIAGLFRPDHLHVSINGTTLADTDTHLFIPPERRRLGLVFQDARLFPHMTVEANLRYGLRRAPPASNPPASNPPGSITFEAITELLGLAPLLARRPHTLSGGERQRTAIGRALLSQPRLLLMDEPLASLDAARKAEILPYLIRLKSILRLPIITITHDPDERDQLADTVVHIQSGHVTAIHQITEAPDDDTILTLTIESHDPARRLTKLSAEGLTLYIPQLTQRSGVIRLRLHAARIILTQEPPSGATLHNILPVEIESLTPDEATATTLVALRHGPHQIRARIPADTATTLQKGAQIHALIPPAALKPQNKPDRS